MIRRFATDPETIPGTPSTTKEDTLRPGWYILVLGRGECELLECD